MCHATPMSQYVIELYFTPEQHWIIAKTKCNKK